MPTVIRTGSGGVGVRVEGLDLSQPLPPEHLQLLQDTWNEYLHAL